MSAHPTESQGGRLVAALATTETVSWGILYYAFGVLLIPMSAEGWSTAALSGAFSVGLLVSATAAVPVGRHIDRHSPRLLMTAGSVAGALLVVAWSQAHTLLELYLVWAGLGLAMACVLYEPAIAVLTRHLPRRRAAALAALTLVAGFASPIFVPLTEALVGSLGWRDALLALAALLAVITVPVHFFSLPRHAPPPQPAAGSRSLRRAVRSPSLWLFTTACALGSFTVTALQVFLVAFLVERGHDTGTAALAVGAMGLMQIPGRLAWPWLHGRLTGEALAAAIFALPAAGIAAALVVPGTVGVSTLVLLAGVGAGLNTLLRANQVADLFGTHAYGAVAGLVSTFATTAKAATPISVAGLALLLGGFDLAFAVLGALSLAATASGWLAHHRHQPIAAPAVGIAFRRETCP